MSKTEFITKPITESKKPTNLVETNREQLEQIKQQFLDGYKKILEAFGLDPDLINRPLALLQ